MTLPLPLIRCDLHEVTGNLGRFAVLLPFGVGGLTEVAFIAPCPSGDRPWTVTATDGALPDFASLDLCENEG